MWKMSKEKLEKENGFLEENKNAPNEITKKKSSELVREKGIGSVRPRSKSKLALETRTKYPECFTGGNFSSQYEDECPVNYSLKYSDTEPCKVTSTSNKCNTTKEEFKDFSDYAETDLDQPTNFSLKYAEKTYEEEQKTSQCNYYNNHKVKFKEYSDYVETDLDQPTDFTLRYRESAEEDVKANAAAFGFYENEENSRKHPTAFNGRPTREDAPPERNQERYASQNETPLMFSRSSSMNSLSSFVHITQSIPDDRSSVVSDFSRMTSGIISPSELPDSPTQTAPSSPKRQKERAGFPAKPEFVGKKSVFEDDVATYKQEDTPVEFSRATSLSSLNLENSLKPEPIMQRNASYVASTKDENQSAIETPEQLKPDKIEQDKGKFELASVLEVDESVFADCISIDIQINCRKPKPSIGRLVVAQENHPNRTNHGFPVKPSLRLRFHSENRKGFSTYEGSDDAVHTYHTEGTPANVSHAGSHSDLSALSIASSVPLSGADENSDNESFFPEETQTIPRLQAETSTGIFDENKSLGSPLSEKVFESSQTELEYLRKDHQLMAKDETATFATENSPCDVSVRSSLSDLTVNVMETISRAEPCEEPPSQMLSPLRNVSPQSPNSIVFEEAEDGDKSLEEPPTDFIPSEALNEENEENEEWEAGDEPTKTETRDDSGCRSETNFDFDSAQPLTPFEEALVEECIRLGMPQKRHPKQVEETHFEPRDKVKTPENSIQNEFNFSKPTKPLKKTTAYPEPNSLNIVNFDLDSSEPLTAFEEVLLEQCIRLGMPQNNHCKRQTKALEDINEESEELITPFETALVEQCIRLGMPQKKNQKKEATPLLEESNKTASCLAAQLNKLKVSFEGNEKEKRVENCCCGKKHSNRKRNGSCKKSKSKMDHFKVESCPV